MAAMTDDRSGGQRTGDPQNEVPVDARTLARGLAVVRILLGLVFLSNGLAKLFDFHRVAFGPVVGNLINRGDARFILDVEVNKNAQRLLPLVGRITNDVVLPNFGLFSWALTAVELAAGVLLQRPVAPRTAARARTPGDAGHHPHRVRLGTRRSPRPSATPMAALTSLRQLTPGHGGPR